MVVNHALLALGATNDSLLPDYDHLVVDEAHNLEEVVTNQWGFTVNEEAFDRVLERVVGGAAAGTGVATPLDALARSVAVSPQRRADYAETVEDLQASVLQARRHLTMLFKELTDFATKRSESGGDYNVSLRLTGALRSQPAWSKLQTDWEQVDIALAKLARGVEKAASLAASAVEGEVPDKEGFLMEAQAVADQLAELRDGLRAGVANPDEGGIYWIEVGARDGVTRLRSAPLHVGADLNQRLFDQKKSVVLTSATLSVGESLGYIEERLSLDSANELMVGSPFDYPNRVLGFFPNDIPEPNRPRLPGGGPRRHRRRGARRRWADARPLHVEGLPADGAPLPPRFAYGRRDRRACPRPRRQPCPARPAPPVRPARRRPRHGQLLGRRRYSRRRAQRACHNQAAVQRAQRSGLRRALPAV